MMNVKYSGRRQDVLNALDTLAAAVPEILHSDTDPRWPDLTNAIHWLIDDTWWDKHDPADSIGLLLRTKTEASAVAAVAKAIDEVAKRQGPAATDRAWFSDPAWPSVRKLAADAAALFRAP